jgi:AcrR family transcriptional regulator
MTPGTPGRPGRRAGASGSREAILHAARGQFGEHGYDGATIRGIAAVAGVDPALVHHFYGSKEMLFVAAMRMPFVPSEAIAAALEASRGERSVGEHMVYSALALWESDAMKNTFLGLLKSAVTSERAAVMLREFFAESILGTIARMSGVRGNAAEVRFRLGLVASQMLGLAVTRQVLALPAVAEASRDELAAAIGPSIDRYLTGEIGPPDRIWGS